MVFALLSLAASGTVFAPAAQAGVVTGNAEVLVTKPGTLVNTETLDFGRVIAGNAASRVTISGTAETISVTSGNAVLAGGGFSRARFQSVNVLPISIVTITLPTTATLTRVGGTQTMQVNNFTQDGLPIRIGLLNRLLTFYVGGTLNVGANQVPGHYRGTFDVVTNLP